MKYKLSMFTLFFMMFFSGCIGSFDAVLDKKTRLGSDTKEYRKITKNIGEVIINKYDYTEIKAIQITEKFEDSGFIGSIHIEKGEFAEKYIDTETEEIYYCGKFYTPIGSDELQKVCFVEEYDEIDTFFVLYKSGNYVGPYTLSNSLSFKKAVTADKKTSYRKIEMLYDGVERGMILFTYREFSDASTRPAFYSQVRYILNKNRPTTIAYKSSKIKIYRANNNSITYEILNPLSMGH